MQRDIGHFVGGFSDAVTKYVMATATNQTRDASLHLLHTMRHLNEEFLAAMDSRPFESADS